MKKLLFLLLLVAGCATTSPAGRRPDPRGVRREAQSASASHSDFESHLLRDRDPAGRAGTEAR